MNDFDWDVLQRKRLAQQAKYRKNGSKSKKCTLPSEWLTQKELKGLSGEVMTYNLSKPMVWKEFKYMPKDLQEQYLEKLRNEHGALQKDVATMLGITPNAFSTYVRKRGIDIFCERKFYLADEVKWRAFLNGETAQQPVEQETATIHDAKAEFPQPVDQKPARKSTMRCTTNFTMNFEGEFDWYAFMEQITRHIHDGEKVEISVRCKIIPPEADPAPEGEDGEKVALGA